MSSQQGVEEGTGPMNVDSPRGAKTPENYRQPEYPRVVNPPTFESVPAFLRADGSLAGTGPRGSFTAAPLADRLEDPFLDETAAPTSEAANRRTPYSLGQPPSIFIHYRRTSLAQETTDVNRGSPPPSTPRYPLSSTNPSSCALNRPSSDLDTSSATQNPSAMETTTSSSALDPASTTEATSATMTTPSSADVPSTNVPPPSHGVTASTTTKPAPLSPMDQAQAGKEAIEAQNYELAVELYTKALTSKPEAVDYYIQRSIAYTRLKPSANYEASLKDAETALLLAYKRERKELILKSQMRRGIALAGLNRLGDADFVFKIVRRIQGPSDYRGPKADFNMLDMWEKRVEGKLGKLSADDDQAKVTVTEKPEEKKEDSAALASEKEEQEQAAARAKAKEERFKAGVTVPVKSIRHEWYQNVDKVTITIYVRYVIKETVEHEINANSIYVSFPTANGEKYEFRIDPLFSPVMIDDCQFSILANGIEFVLRKADRGLKWSTLQGKPGDTSSAGLPLNIINPKGGKTVKGNTTTTAAPAPSAIPSVTPPGSTAPSYPTSSRSGPKDWDKVAKELTAKKSKKPDGGASDEEEDDDDDGPGDGADKFFRKLYSGADPDVRRAMMKSFVESDGTALSTNWEDVKKGKVEPVPPKDD